MDQTQYYSEALFMFHKHYQTRFQTFTVSMREITAGYSMASICSPEVKDGNEARIYLQKNPTDQVVILLHGLSDSPHYVSAIGESFFKAGANVIIPLMPAHGLKDPDEAMEDCRLDAKWKLEIDTAVEIARLLGGKISLGGFSSGGAVCYNKVLRDSNLITGGLFLFAAAIDVKLRHELRLVQFVTRLAQRTDGEIKGCGMDPFKYPKLPLFAALELGQIISENLKLSKGLRINQPVFVAHGIHDKTAKFAAIIKLLKKHTKKGVLYTIANKMAHAELPLKNDIVLDENYKLGKPAYANPDFDLMMKSCISFYENRVVKTT